MVTSTQAKTKSKAEQEAQHKAVRRAEQANILAGVRPILDKDEQLLSFARARIAGGWRSKLNVGPEAFFAPYVNVALTERRFLVQHIQPASGKPSQMLPHAYTFDKVARVTFTEIETYGADPACRLILHLENNLFVRLRLRGLLNVESAKSMAKLFDSLTTAKRAVSTPPTQSACPRCERLMDQPHRFCPYCGTQQPPRTTATAETAYYASHVGITLAVPVTDSSETAEQVTEKVLSPAVETPLPLDLQPIATISVPRETDFAYEREDRQAEFGFALPLPESMFTEDDLEVLEDITVPEAESPKAETQKSEEAAESKPEIAEAAIETMETSDSDFALESLNDIDIFAMTPNAEVVEISAPELEQYDIPAYTESEARPASEDKINVFEEDNVSKNENGEHSA